MWMYTLNTPQLLFSIHLYAKGAVSSAIYQKSPGQLTATSSAPTNFHSRTIIFPYLDRSHARRREAHSRDPFLIELLQDSLGLILVYSDHFSLSWAKRRCLGLTAWPHLQACLS